MKGGEKRWTKRLLALALALTALALLASCGEDDSGEQKAKPRAPTPTAEVTEYVGTLSGVDPDATPSPGDYFIALVVRPTALAFVSSTQSTACSKPNARR